MSRSARKPTLLTLRTVSTRISLSMPCRLIRKYTFRPLWIFVFMKRYSIPIGPDQSAWTALAALGRYITQMP